MMRAQIYIKGNGYIWWLQIALKWTLTRKSAEMAEVKGSPLKVIRLLDKVLLILI